MEKILKDAKELNKIPSINQGGCGIAALALKRKHKKGNIVQLIAGFFVQFAHIALKIDDKIIDTTGQIKQSSLNKYNSIEDMTEEDLINTINNKSAWSAEFDRNKIKTISENLNINLNDIIK